ncbi:hypothetical protein INT43_006935 [Umbelopsis isabellina]|uniref:RRM domain-containing protein n=1 Tax=Mortierella isabellina TaxID=91625 RepID=A0A8H7PWN8_MORIS|nr:hypothetical protein INT43_006935 [Umbelopsis isabellina]
MPRPVTRSSSKPQAASKVASKPANTKAQPAKRKAAAAPAKAQKKAKAEDVVKSAETKSNEQEESTFAQEVDAISDDDDSSVEENELEEDEKAIETNKADEEEPESNEVAEDHEILAGIDSSEDEDSSDDEAAKEDTFSTGQDVITLGSKKDKELKTKTATVKKSPSDKPGVIYLGRIPHGFYEEQMRAYFAQFGEVSRLRMSRNRKTGRSKHFAFIEFKTGEVADIVAETMNNYLLYGHLLKCQVVPEEKQHPKLWDGADRKFKAIPWNKLAREQQNKAKTPEQREKLVSKLVKKDQKKREKLAAMGVEYEFPGYEAEIKPKATHVKF